MQKTSLFVVDNLGSDEKVCYRGGALARNLPTTSGYGVPLKQPFSQIQTSSGTSEEEGERAEHAGRSERFLACVSPRKDKLFHHSYLSKFSPLQDAFCRTFTYLRIALTDRCPLRCRYCMPAQGLPFLPPWERLAIPELKRLASIFATLGIQKIRLTGGEPLIYPELLEMLRAIRTIPEIQDLSITTNGQRLSTLAKPLKESGLDRVNVSLDSLQPERFTWISRGGKLADTLRGIDLSLEAGLTPLKVNCVVMRGINDDELVSFCQFASEKAIEVRFLEMMPTQFTESGKEALVTVDEMQEKLQAAGIQLTLLPRDFGETAERYQIPGTPGTLGFIGTVTQKFCDHCNRIRLLPNGFLKLCLHHETGIQLRDLLQQGLSDESIALTIREAVWQKPWGSEFKATQFTQSSTVMSQVGG